MLSRILSQHEDDPWIVTAALSSADGCGPELLAELIRMKVSSYMLISRVAALVGGKGNGNEIISVLTQISESDLGDTAPAVLSGLGQGMRDTKMPLSAWFVKPPAGGEKAIVKLRERFQKVAESLSNKSLATSSRVAAAKLLAYGPFDIAGPSLAVNLTPTTPGDVQLAAVRARVSDGPLGRGIDPQELEELRTGRRAAALDAMLARPDRVLGLLTAIEKKQVLASELSIAQVQQLMAHPNMTVKARANSVLKQRIDSDRSKVVAAFTPALELKGDAKAGIHSICQALRRMP